MDRRDGKGVEHRYGPTLRISFRAERHARTRRGRRWVSAVADIRLKLVISA